LRIFFDNTRKEQELFSRTKSESLIKKSSRKSS